MPLATTSPATEIIAFSSGKGGTGKTLIVSSLGYALVRAGHRVLMIDGDPGTHGLSLFLLGPKGYQQVGSFEAQNTFTGALRAYKPDEPLQFEPRSIHRTAADDHGVSYEALISTPNVYGDVPERNDDLVVPDLDRRTFDAAVAALFDELRSLRTYDYVLVDTRGGFGFESTDICALADSFILVTEPDFTSFYQDRNLVKRVSAAAQEAKRKPLLRSIIVNKATEGGQTEGALDLTKLEASFRLELTREFPVEYANTHPVPLDVEAVKAYKTQRMPYLAAPGSQFSFSTLAAFTDILRVVTSRWTEERVRQWNALVDTVSQAVLKRNEDMQRAKSEGQQHTAALKQAQATVAEQAQQIVALHQRIDEQQQANERELKRTELLLNERTQTSAKEQERARVQRTASVFATLVLVLTAGAVAYWWVAKPSTETIVERAYTVTMPPQVRINYVIQLRTRGWHNLDNIDLSNLTFPAGDWNGTSFRHANLSGVLLRGAIFTNVNFAFAKLTGADLSGASFDGSDLSEADLSGAKLVKTRLSRARFEHTDLRDALLDGSDITRKQLTNCILNPETLLLMKGNPSDAPFKNLILGQQ